MGQRWCGRGAARSRLWRASRPARALLAVDVALVSVVSVPDIRMAARQAAWGLGLCKVATAGVDLGYGHGGAKYALGAPHRSRGAAGFCSVCAASGPSRLGGTGRSRVTTPIRRRRDGFCVVGSSAASWRRRLSHDSRSSPTARPARVVVGPVRACLTANSLLTCGRPGRTRTFRPAHSPPPTHGVPNHAQAPNPWTAPRHTRAFRPACGGP